MIFWKYELYQKNYSIESYSNLLIVIEKQTLNPLWMLHRAGRITAFKCYDGCHTDTEKISSPSLLATIMQYSKTKSNKHTPCIGASLDDVIATCSCHEIRRLEIKCPYNYQKGLVNWDKDRTYPIDRSDSIKKTHLYYY